MKHAYFEIKNFKGIIHVKIDLAAQPRGNIFTLVGLNESEKTTILQALNFHRYNTDDLNSLNLPGYSVKDVHELMPISKRSNFNDEVVITTDYSINAKDMICI